MGNEFASMTREQLDAMPLSGGKGDNPETLCLQQKANVIRLHMAGVMETVDLNHLLTDHGCWQNAVINHFGIWVNDALDPSRFDELDARMPLLVAATKRSDPLIEERINARLLCALARRVLHIFEEVFPEDDRPRKAIEAREAWLDDPTAPTAAEAARAAEAFDEIEWLDWLLDQWEKAVAQEGAMLDDGWADALRGAGLLEDSAGV